MVNVFGNGLKVFLASPAELWDQAIISTTSYVLVSEV